MRNRKCGTCRFYQEAQLASSGWCHHPQRKTTSDIMIMVRKNELACRDEWAHDLWEAKSAQPETAAALGQFGDRKERPATEAEIAAILAANASSTNQQEAKSEASEVASDIVLSELGAGPEPNTYVERVEPPREWAQASSRSVEPTDTSAKKPDHATTARGAIIRAREAYRERTRQVASRSQEIARLAASTPRAPLASTTSDSDHVEDSPLVPAAEASAPAHDQAPDVVAVSADTLEPETDDIVLSSGDVDAAAYGSRAVASGSGAFADAHGLESDRPDWMDDLDEAANSHRAASRDSNLVAEREATAARHQRLDDSFEAGRSTRPEQPASMRPRGSRTDLYGDDERKTPARTDRAPMGEPGESTSRPSYADRPHYWSASHQKGDHYRPTDESHHAESPVDKYDVAYNNIDLDMVDDIAATADQIELEAARDWDRDGDLDDDYQADDVVADDIDPRDEVIPLRPTLSAHLPRICRTCRDFRPAETGDRGWCANQWAFSHRRVVAADEQAPCESVLGDWWLPADEVWSDAADVSSHGQPTPLLDAWLPEYQEHQPSRRRS